MAQIRIGHTLCDLEQKFIADRKPIIQQCLQRRFIPCTMDTLPNIALLGSGGGERAMIGLLASLSQMQKEDLLDSILYLSGVSGSTWCMTSVYEYPQWSTMTEIVKQEVAQRVGHGSISSWKCVKKLIDYYYHTDHFSLTHVWAVAAVPSVVKNIDEHNLSSYQSGHDKDPYPIYSVIDQDSKYDKIDLKDVFFELTPHEAGYSLAGAFVETPSFGCEFKEDVLIRKQPEMDMNYIQGLCGSALADREVILQYLKEWLEGLITKTEENEGLMILDYLVTLNLQAIRNEDYTCTVQCLNQLLEGMETGFPDMQISLDGIKTASQARTYFMERTMNACQSFLQEYPDLENEETTVLVHSIQKVVEGPAKPWTDYLPTDMEGLKEFVFNDKAETMKALMDLIEKKQSTATQKESEALEVLLLTLKLNYSLETGDDWIPLASDLNGRLQEKKNIRGESMRIYLEQWKKANAEKRREFGLRYTLEVCLSFYDWFHWMIKAIWDFIVKIILKIVEAMLKECWIWGTTYNFLSQDTEAEEVDPEIRAADVRHFEDAGLLLNSPYFSVLRPEREIDLIISLDFSEGDPMDTVVDTWKKCQELHLPFPAVSASDEDRKAPKNIYVFRGYGKEPTVIHMPLFNINNCGDKLDWWRNQYTTFQGPYSAEMIEALMVKAAENITATKDRLLEEIRNIVQEKKSSASLGP